MSQCWGTSSPFSPSSGTRQRTGRPSSWVSLTSGSSRRESSQPRAASPPQTLALHSRKSPSKNYKFFFHNAKLSLLGWRNGPKLSFQDWNRYLDEISTAKKLDVNTVKTKLVDCGEPGFTGETVSRRKLSLHFTKLVDFRKLPRMLRWIDWQTHRGDLISLIRM